jgi:ATP-dependent Clp protease ATP-binding subunit ClpA
LQDGRGGGGGDDSYRHVVTEALQVFAPGTKKLLDEAERHANASGRAKINTIDLLFAIVSDFSSGGDALRKSGVTAEAVTAWESRVGPLGDDEQGRLKRIIESALTRTREHGGHAVEPADLIAAAMALKDTAAARMMHDLGITGGPNSTA